jgi:hypothetical protein
MGEQAQEASDLALSEAARRPESATQPTALHLDFIRASEQEAEARSSEQRKQLETMAAAQVERENALHQAEEALKQAADAQRKRTSIRIALVVVSVLLVVAGSYGWGAEQKRRIAEQQRETAEQLVKQREAAEMQQKAAEQYRKAAEQQKEQTDTALARATKIVAQDKDKDPAKVREFLEWAAGKGSDEAKTALRSLDDAPVDTKDDGKLGPRGEADGSSGKATAKGNKNARFKPLSTASRAAFWRWRGGHLAIEVSPAARRATASW